MGNFLKSPTTLFTIAGITFLLFDIQVYLLKELPASVGNACSPGGYFTPGNLLFALAISILIAINTVIFYHLRGSSKSTTGAISFLGIFFATITSFCTLCLLPAISVFGLGISLVIFTNYLIQFKALAFLLLLSNLLLLHHQLKKGCQRPLSKL